MKALARLRIVPIGAVAAGAIALLSTGIGSCGSAPTPFLVVGPGVTGNDPPAITILEPNRNTTVDRGSLFLIRWSDSDSDDNALISFSLIQTSTNDRIVLVTGLAENDTVGPDQVSVSTSLIPVGTYNLLGIIEDGVNPPVESFAFTTAEAVQQRVVLTVVEEGTGPPTRPPIVAVTQPAFNLSVAQDDMLTVTVQPSELAPNATTPFDGDSDITLYIVLDVDQDPNNDDPASPDPAQIIGLAQQTVTAGSSDAISFPIRIDLATIPPLPGGEPYFIRATADDGTNPRVHNYAVGTISVVQLAAGTVDLFDIGRDKSGVRWYGFTPGANLGSSISHIGDFDGDGVDDFVLVAQFGNPRNFGLVGEAYLIYGRDGVRFGGAIGVNSVSQTVSGVLFEAPPVRRNPETSDGTCNISGQAFTEGITDVSFIRDLSGDGQPELLFGLPHVHGAFEAMDFDPGDQDLAASDNTVDIEVVIRQGRVTVQEGTANPVETSQTYNGVDEVTIDSAQPNISFGSDEAIAWLDNGASDRKWSLMKFREVLFELPDNFFDVNTTVDFTTLQATLELRVFNTGSGGSVFQALTDFTEQTTFGNYAVNGGEPAPGVDYVISGAGQGALGTFEGAVPDVVRIDVTPVMQQLVDGQLRAANDELRFLIAAFGEEAANEAAARSSEFSIENSRPTLRIEYTRLNLLGARGCYPDSLVNNRTDEGTEDPFEVQFTAGGMAVMLDSTNRDNQPRQSPAPARLDTTTIALELVGQQGGFPFGLNSVGFSLPGSVRAFADDYDQEGRIRGARFMGGHYDCVDHLLLNQPGRSGYFGQYVASIGDLNNDGLDEIIISAPRNERYLQDLRDTFGVQSTHLASTGFGGSIAVIPGRDYSAPIWRERNTADDSNASIPTLDQHRNPPHGRCQPSSLREIFVPGGAFEVFAESLDDMLGGASSAGDFNQDGLDDILCGAPLNNRSTTLEDTGAVYILYGRNLLDDFDLSQAGDSLLRPPMLRMRGVTPGDQIGWRQTRGLDVNGDRIDDVFISSPHADFGGVIRSSCARDFTGDGVITGDDLSLSSFDTCSADEGEDVFTDSACKAFDYNNDGVLDDADEEVLLCLVDDGTDCCQDLVDNGFVGILFGGVFTDGDRTISQIATPDLPGVVFFGAAPGHRAGVDVSSAGDFNQDGFGDILIAVPGETRLDQAGRERLGVVYLVFGGTHLYNRKFSLDRVGSDDLPGLVFLSPYVKGRPNEAAPTTVAFVGDINNDGFGDIAIGSPKADFIDLSFPQGPNATDAELGRRRNAGDVYIVYGNNFGSNRGGGG